MYKKVQNSCRTRKILPCKATLYYPWNNEYDIISPFTAYHESHISKQDVIHQNAERFNEDHVAFDVDLQDLEKQYTTVCMGDGCSKYSTG